MATQDTSATAEDSESLIQHTTDIVVSYVANNSIGAEEVSPLIRNIHATLAGLGAEGMQEPGPGPAVSVRASVKSDHIVCLEDGRKFKTLKRHLRTDHGMTPDEYRARWLRPTMRRRDVTWLKRSASAASRANASPRKRPRRRSRRRLAQPERSRALPSGAPSRPSAEPSNTPA